MVFIQDIVRGTELTIASGGPPGGLPAATADPRQTPSPAARLAQARQKIGAPFLACGAQLWRRTDRENVGKRFLRGAYLRTSGSQIEQNARRAVRSKLNLLERNARGAFNKSEHKRQNPSRAPIELHRSSRRSWSPRSSWNRSLTKAPKWVVWNTGNWHGGSASR